MHGPAARESRVRFGAYELDLKTSELRKSGVLLRLPPQPFRVLALLASRPSELVTREELRDRIWGADTFVDFEHGLNFAIKKIRDTLGDDAETPRYIETLPRRGYRFIAPVDALSPSLAGQPSDRRIAVLPFVNGTGDPSLEYLSDGLTDILIGTLSQLPHLRVMARSTVFRYKGKDELPQEIGRKLQVGAVLMGTVMQRTGVVEIQVDLVDTTDGTEVWGSRYAREMASITQLQSDITRDVSRSLRIRLGANEEQRLGIAGTANSEAYRLYLEGRQLWYGRTTEGLKRSIELFQQAILADPAYALAYSGLADTYDVLPNYGAGINVRRALLLADEASRKAVELDSSLPEAHLSRASSLALAWKWSEAEAEYRYALELNPNSANGHYFYAFTFLAPEKHLDEALNEFGIALSLDPLSAIVNTNYATTLMMARRYPEALTQFQKALELDPNLDAAHLKLSHLHAVTGHFEEAIAELQAYSPTPGSWTADAKGYNELTLATVPNQGDWQAYAALTFALLGDSEKTFEYLERAFSDADTNLPACIRFPALDPMRSDSRYTNLVRRLGLPE